MARGTTGAPRNAPGQDTRNAPAPGFGDPGAERGEGISPESAAIRRKPPGRVRMRPPVEVPGGRVLGSGGRGSRRTGRQAAGSGEERRVGLSAVVGRIHPGTQRAEPVPVQEPQPRAGRVRARQRGDRGRPAEGEGRRALLRLAARGERAGRPAGGVQGPQGDPDRRRREPRLQQRHRRFRHQREEHRQQGQRRAERVRRRARRPARPTRSRSSRGSTPPCCTPPWPW